MRATVLANLIVLGACGRASGTHAHVADTQTVVHPDRVPATVATSVPTPGVASAGARDRTPGVVTEATPAGDTPPQMRNAHLPFRYPGALYARRVQGDVTLRLWVDSTGRVRPESTHVAESSGTHLLDSAAVAGSVRLEFTPARREGRPIAAPLLFPVHFRHPALRPHRS